MPENTRYEKDVLSSAASNHIWIDGISCINPSESFLKELGTMVIRMLNNDDNLILSDFDNSSFSKLQMKELVVRINKS